MSYHNHRAPVVQADEWPVAEVDRGPVARLPRKAPVSDHEASAPSSHVGARLFGRRAP